MRGLDGARSQQNCTSVEAIIRGSSDAAAEAPCKESAHRNPSRDPQPKAAATMSQKELAGVHSRRKYSWPDLPETNLTRSFLIWRAQSKGYDPSGIE
jgi:hypothetical protein